MRAVEKREPLVPAWLRSSRMIALYSVVAGLGAWQLAYMGLARTIYFEAYAIHHFLSSPLQVIETFGELYRSGELFKHSYFSLLEFAYGFVLSVVVGIPVGFLMATQKKINYYLDPWVSCIYATPRVALAPIIIVWFGLGILPNALIVFLGAVFPILLNTYTGIKSVRQNLIEVVKAFGGSALQVFFKVMIPDATPAIIAGLRLAVGRAVIGVVVAEWFGAEAGLGYMVYFYSQLFQPGPVFVGIVVLVVFGILSFMALDKAQGWISPWYAYQVRREVHGMEME
ncbi:MAG: ABC transporter permease [Deltaproteobacteria bacterium]|nr:ABC transporter permease [Deltaproteobacteria bacterium]